MSLTNSPLTEAGSRSTGRPASGSDPADNRDRRGPAHRDRLRRLAALWVLFLALLAVSGLLPRRDTPTSIRRDGPGGRGAIVSLVLLPVLPVGVSAVVSPGERQGLVNLYMATNGPSWTGATGWSNYAAPGVDPCAAPYWTGVDCVTAVGGSSVVYVLATVVSCCCGTRTDIAGDSNSCAAPIL